MHLISPTIDAAAALTHPEVADAFVDVVARPGDRKAAIALERMPPA